MASINLGRRGEIRLGHGPVETGISKLPSTEAVVATSVGIDGDFKARGHSNGFQALSAYALENYEYWSPHFGRELGPGTFGENLTLRGASEETVHLGGRFFGEEVVLEVTYPRTPCKKLNVHVGERFSGSFLQSGRVGYYLRVVEAGRIAPGERLNYRCAVDAPTVREFVMNGLVEYWDHETLARLARVSSLSDEWRERIWAKVERAKEAPGWIGPRSLKVDEIRRIDGLAHVALSCARGRLLPEMAAGDTLSFDHRPDLLAAAESIVSRPAATGASNQSVPRDVVDAYRLVFDELPTRVVEGSTVRARAPSSLLRY